MTSILENYKKVKLTYIKDKIIKNEDEYDNKYILDTDIIDVNIYLNKTNNFKQGQAFNFTNKEALYTIVLVNEYDIKKVNVDDKNIDMEYNKLIIINLQDL